MDNRVTEQMQKIPGIGDIPILGKLFQTKSLNRSKNELVVVVTPHIIHPLPAGEPTPNLKYPDPFLPPTVGKPAKGEVVPGTPAAIGVHQ
jgi:pilus assembly protein CpaC